MSALPEVPWGHGRVHTGVLCPPLCLIMMHSSIVQHRATLCSTNLAFFSVYQHREKGNICEDLKRLLLPHSRTSGVNLRRILQFWRR